MTTLQPISLAHLCGQKLLDTTDPSEEMPARASIRGIEAEDVVYNQHLSGLHLETTQRWNQTEPGSIAGVHLQRAASESNDFPIHNVTQLNADQYIQVVKRMAKTAGQTLIKPASGSLRLINDFDPKSVLNMEKWIEDLNLMKLWVGCTSDNAALTDLPETPDEIREWLKDPDNVRQVQRPINNFNPDFFNSLTFMPPEGRSLIDFGGQDELLIAAFNGDLLTLKPLIQDSPSAGHALFSAVINNQVHIVAFFLDPEQNPFPLPEESLVLAQIFAIDNQRDESLGILLNSRGEDYEIAAFNGDLEKLKQLVNDPLSARKAFYYAVLTNQTHIIEYLLDPDQNPYEIDRDMLSQSGLRMAGKRGFSEIFKITLSHFPESEMILADLMMPLFEAVHNGNLEIVESILDVSLTKRMVTTAFKFNLQVAILNGNRDMVELLVKHDKMKDVPFSELGLAFLVCRNAGLHEIAEILGREARKRCMKGGKYILAGLAMAGTLYTVYSQYFS